MSIFEEPFEFHNSGVVEGAMDPDLGLQLWKEQEEGEIRAGVSGGGGWLNQRRDNVTTFFRKED